MSEMRSGGGLKIFERVRDLLPRWFQKDSVTIPIVVLTGMIAPESGGVRSGRSLSLQGIEDLLSKAFKTRGAKAVALIVNSPGGSPVQSALISGRIRALSEEFSLPVYAFCEDVAASGGYWIACCADEIHANSSSIVGSIGVISGGFGLDKLIARYGIERRLKTAGENKGMLDTFSPENPKHVKRFKAILSDLHEQFISWVRERRGEKLAQDDEEIFSGAFWTGRRALELGLIDGIGDCRTVLREKFGDKVSMPVLQVRRGVMARFGMEAMVRAHANFHADALVQQAFSEAERRIEYGRFGL